MLNELYIVCVMRIIHIKGEKTRCKCNISSLYYNEPRKSRRMFYGRTIVMKFKKTLVRIYISGVPPDRFVPAVITTSFDL